jgi:hypothetical protein
MFVDAELIRRIVIQVVDLICGTIDAIIFIVIIIAKEINKCFGIDFTMFSRIISGIVGIGSITTAATCPTAAITFT